MVTSRDVEALYLQTASTPIASVSKQIHQNLLIKYDSALVADRVNCNFVSNTLKALGQT